MKASLEKWVPETARKYGQIPGLCAALLFALCPAVARAGAVEPDGDEVLAKIVLESLPLRTAVTALARQASLKITFDPSFPATGGSSVTVKWKNVTARHALEALLDNEGWGMKKIPGTETFRIVTRNSSTVKSRREVVDLLARKETNGIPSEDLIPIKMDKVPLRTVVPLLAQQAALNVLFDPKLAGQLDVEISQGWTNTTSRRVLQDLLLAHGLQATRIPGNPILRISARNPKE